ncbi:MAG: RNA-binding protein [Chloroflexi bacterium]|nr:MAG: RNA-binding protein [Chloroflexota bacterium]
MDTKLFVGNLSFNTTEDDLRTLFAGAGEVTSIQLIKDRETGRSKGFAFVEMSSQSEAESAIKQFNGYSLNNRELKIDKARPKQEFSPSGYNSRSSQGGGGWKDKNRRTGGGGGTRRY